MPTSAAIQNRICGFELSSERRSHPRRGEDGFEAVRIVQLLPPAIDHVAIRDPVRASLQLRSRTATRFVVSRPLGLVYMVVTPEDELGLRFALGPDVGVIQALIENPQLRISYQANR
jgi:hypothetical protein